jgi:hypothetical protein
MRAVVGDEEALVDLAFPIHALAAPGLAHQGGEAMLQNAGADAAEHIFAAVLLEHDIVDALEVQKLRQEQARRPAADDANLDFHAFPASSSPLRPRVAAALLCRIFKRSAGRRKRGFAAG